MKSINFYVTIQMFGLYLFTMEGVSTIMQGTDCVPKNFGFGSFVCICNSSYCDALLPIKTLDKGKMVVVMSSKAKKRWFIQEFSMKRLFLQSDKSDIAVEVNRKEKYQEILGFGGAFTDSTGINLNDLPRSLQDEVMRGYFGEEGLEYNLARVPIAGTDFSTHPYSYDDLGKGREDPTLKHFSLADEDFKYKIPYIKEALSLASKRGVTLKMYASPWSGPGWMKTNGRINGDGRLKKTFYAVWASYIIRFLKEYGKHGISFFAVTAQNEPMAGLLFKYAFNQMAWRPKEQGIWIGENLGPQLHESGFGNVSVFILDDQRLLLPFWAVMVFKQPNASQYIGGIGVHWYWDSYSPSIFLDWTHNMYPNIPILYTEACEGPWDSKKVIPGSWERAENYAHNIMENLQHWVVGWTDWNLALNLEGGPNWVENYVDSPILVNKATQEVYKQPMYYALAHFSKILPEGSIRIAHEIKGSYKKYVEVVAFTRPDNATALIINNKNSFSLTMVLHDDEISCKIVLDPRSIVSLIWR